jgi:energy-coupling factor transporter ATP-binding protein EcfA2
MRIEKMRIRNFKSIVDTGEMVLNNNLVVLVGKNNAGKTAILEALYRCFKGVFKFHYAKGSGDGSPEGIRQSSPALFDLWINFSNEEQRLLFEPFFPQEAWSERIWVSLEANNGITCANQITVFKPGSDEEFLTFYYSESHANYLGYHVTSAGDTPLQQDKVLRFIPHVYSTIAQSFVFVTGNRVVQPIHHAEVQLRLDTNASNLHGVLYALHNNQEDIFDEIERKFIDIFPDVEDLQTRIVQSNGATNCHVKFKDGLTIPLQDCGTGLTQVLIMLCVVHSANSRIVLFDEPHIFLHPSAEKSIYDLATKEKHHQFIFTTHSPILLNYPVEKTVYLVQKVEGQSVYRPLDSIEDALADIGVVNSDLALSDRVLFVEGDTEELLLTRIVIEFELIPFGQYCKIIPLGGSGKIAMSSREMRRNAELMEKVLSAVSKLPVPYHIVLDRDERDDSTIERIVQQYGTRVKVLPRREIENYILDCKGISAVLKRCGVEVDESDIERTLANLLEQTDNRDLFPRGCSTSPLVDVKGSAVLEHIFNQYGLTYDKKRHGQMLMDWILSNNKDLLDELVETLKSVLTAN